MPWTKPYHPAQNRRLDVETSRSAGQVCFITIRAFGQRPPFTRADLCRLALGVLRDEQARQGCTVYTYCLMPDHLHFLVSAGGDGTSVLTFAEQYKGKSTNRSWTVGWRGKLWQPRFYDHVVRAEEDLAAIAEYILANPVRAGLVETVEDWPWGGHMNPLPR